MQERRKFKRESLAPFTELFPEDGSEPVSGYPTDMSRGGLALESERPLEEGTRVNVAVHFSSADSEADADDAEPAGSVEFLAAEVTRVVPLGERHKVSVAFDGLSEFEHPTLYGVLRFIDG